MTARALAGFLMLELVSGCVSLEQTYRDQKRYEAMERGTEIYRLADEAYPAQGFGDPASSGSTKSAEVNSLDAGLRAANAEMANYRNYRAITRGQDVPFSDIDGEVADLLSKLDTLELQLDKQKNGDKTACKTKIDDLRKDLRKIRREKAEAIRRQDIDALLAKRKALDDARKQYAKIETSVNLAQPQGTSTVIEALRLDDQTGKASASAMPGGAGARSEIGIIWPEGWLEKFAAPAPSCKPGETCANPAMPEELIRALSSTASIAQMRDLLTEPSFPMMLPTERRVTLGCLPPPDSAAFEAVHKLKANLQDKKFNDDGKAKTDRSATLETEFSSSVVKLFEESERTLFLQYALFRLCEMSVNAPAGFRNVYPVIIHDIVRRTAEMNQVALKETEERKKAEAALEAKKQETEQIKLKDEIDAKNRRRKCVDDLLDENKPSAAEKSAKLDEYNKTCAKLE